MLLSSDREVNKIWTGAKRSAGNRKGMQPELLMDLYPFLTMEVRKLLFPPFTYTNQDWLLLEDPLGLHPIRDHKECSLLME